MASRWYLRPSAGSETQTTLPYHPSEPISLDHVYPNQGTLPMIPPPLFTAIATRNDELVEKLKHEVVTEYEEDGELMRRVRTRQKAWSHYHALHDDCDKEEQQGPDVLPNKHQKLRQMDDALPRSFQFHRDHPLMHRLWSDAHPSTESAVVLPVPCHLLQTPHRYPFSNQPSLSSVEREKAPIPQARQAASPASSPASPPLILSISVYSRHVLRSTRETRARAAAEKRYKEFQEDQTDRPRGSKSLSLTAGEVLPGSGQKPRGQGQRENHDNSNRENQAIYETREHNLFLSKFGTFRDERQQYPRPSQKLEMYSTQSLQDLCDGIVCRMDDLPERYEEAGIQQHDASPTDVKGRARYTGRKRQGGRVVLIEDCLAGQQGSRVLEHVRRHLLSLPTFNSAQLRGGDLSSIRLSDFTGKLCLHKPYWYCHQDICEHFFTIDEVRLPDMMMMMDPSAAADQDKLPRQSPPAQATSTSNLHTPDAPSPHHQDDIHRYPLTTYLMTAQLDRPTATLARLRGTQEAYALGQCSICDKLASRFILVGGERLGGRKNAMGRGRKRSYSDLGSEEDEMRQEQEESSEAGNHTTTTTTTTTSALPSLPALKCEVEGVCPTCLAALTGHVLPLPRAGKKVDRPIKAVSKGIGDYKDNADADADDDDQDREEAGVPTVDQEGRGAGAGAGAGARRRALPRDQRRGVRSEVTMENQRRNSSVVEDGFNVGWHDLQPGYSRGGSRGSRRGSESRTGSGHDDDDDGHDDDDDGHDDGQGQGQAKRSEKASSSSSSSSSRRGWTIVPLLD